MSKKDLVPLHIEWTPGWVRAVDIATGNRAEAVTLKKLGQITNGHKQALVAVGRKIVFLKSVRLPKALPDDLRRIIGVQISQFFPLPANQMSFDFIQTGNQNQEGFLTIVAAIRADDLRLLHTELKEVGLTAQRVLPIALASSVIAAKSGNVDALVVEFDRGEFSLDVVAGSFLRFSRVAPVGADLELESKRTLAAANLGEVPTVVCGNTAPLGTTPSTDSALNLLHEAPVFNFELAESRVLHEKQRIAVRLRTAALLTIAAIVLVIGVWMDRQHSQALIDQTTALSSAGLLRLQSIESDQSAVTQRLTTLQDDLDQAFKPAQQLSDISAFVSDALPAGAWLTGLTVERAKAVQVHGTAKSAAQVAAFVDKLGASPRFANVKLIFANSAMIGGTQVIEFNVTADCVGNLPMPTPEKDDTAQRYTASAASTTESSQ